jgi:hypothetical protein
MQRSQLTVVVGCFGSACRDDEGKKPCCWKVKKECRSMVFRDNVDIGAMPDFLGTTIMSRFSGNCFSLVALKGWLVENWVGILGYCPEYHTLAKGWIRFQFKCRKELEDVFSRVWRWGISRIILK